MDFKLFSDPVSDLSSSMWPLMLVAQVFLHVSIGVLYYWIFHLHFSYYTLAAEYTPELKAIAKPISDQWMRETTGVSNIKDVKLFKNTVKHTADYLVIRLYSKVKLTLSIINNLLLPF